ncbi:ATPase, T2SS/T4P/T4SS family (plasmid) [Niallia taxi]|uniref:CpaF/VirB11 family protein n=1 Tax=Niallia taxi TaxID=2499688 RepID=UPI001F3D4AF1|nr:CpaF/VirB11 family protein [Niallia taxi]MDK8643835.1 CpaF/VirB11 family protein [Niallia taxi]MED4057615.1 CpaF/VirB11 family protein [Niallia taxi]
MIENRLKVKTPWIKPEILKNIQESLIQSHAELIVRGLLDPAARDELKQVVMKEHPYEVRGNEDIVEYIVQETVGTGIIEEIIRDETVTDIGYNGTDLIIETNDKKMKYTGNREITEEYIIRIIQKFANANGKDFTPKNPILDGKFGNIRINAVHGQISTAGTTMSLRVVRPQLALREDNFVDFAPEFMYAVFESVIKLRTNIVISGETGTGKTEFQKLLASFIDFKHKIVLIEDTPETFLKEMFPDKDILSWLTSADITITDLVKAALRNNPRWILVSETRGQEAYEMIQAVLSGHHIVTSLHAINARAIPKRLINMAKMGYTVSEEALEGDIRRYFDFGVHIKRVEYQNQIIRYLDEVVEFSEDKDQTIFQQQFKDGYFTCKTGSISNELKDLLSEKGIKLEFPENQTFTRPVSFLKQTKNIDH